MVTKINFTFNWFYADDRDIGYFNSGDNPVRRRRRRPRPAQLGHGRVRLAGLGDDLQDRPTSRPSRSTRRWSTRTTSPPGTTSRRPATTPPTTVRLRPGLPLAVARRARSSSGSRGADKMSLPELIDSMEVAGTVDLRATQVLPLMLQVVGTPSDPQLADAVADAAGLGRRGRAPRSTADQDGQYDHSDAVQIMDAWWPRALEAEFEPEMGARLLRRGARRCSRFDNEPNNHGGPPRQRLPGRLVRATSRRTCAACSDSARRTPLLAHATAAAAR